MVRLLATVVATSGLVAVWAPGCQRGSGRSADAPPPAAVRNITAAFGTAALAGDPDDPAIWVHPSDPARSLILGTLKQAAPDGAIAVFGVDGRIRQIVSGLDRPNNVDVEYGFRLDGRRVDIAVATERLKRQLRVFRIDPEVGRLVDLGGVPVLESLDGEAGAPMGIALYRRDRDGEIFAIVSPKTGPRSGYLWQYRLFDAGDGRLGAAFVRRFGSFSGETSRPQNEIEAVAVDDPLGYVYYADEADGIHKWHADPDHPHAGRELAHFGRDGFRGDREGIAIYAADDGTGYIVCTDQLDGSSEYHVYAREGTRDDPHDHTREIAVVRGGADATDGLEISGRPFGSGMPHGVMVAMNSGPRNFLLFSWEEVSGALGAARGRYPAGGVRR